MTASSTDWQDAVLRCAPVSNAELAVSGGDERLRYRVSGTWFDQNGIVRASGYRRVGGRVNLDFSPTGPLSLSTGARRLRRQQRPDRERRERRRHHHQRGRRGARRSPVTARCRGVYEPGDGLKYPNPAALALSTTQHRQVHQHPGQRGGPLPITPAFQFTRRFGLDLVNLREDQFESRLVSGTYACERRGVAKSGYSNANKYVMDNFAHPGADLGVRHEFEVTAGGSLELNRSELNFVRGEGFSSDEFTQVRNATIIIEFDGTNSENNLVSFFARAQLHARREVHLRREPPDGRVVAVRRRTTVGASFRGLGRVGPERGVRAFRAASSTSSSCGPATVSPATRRSATIPYQGLVRQRELRRHAGHRAEQPAQPRPQVGDDDAVQRRRRTWRSRNGRVSLTVDWYHKNTEDLLLERPITGHHRLHQRVRQRGQRDQPRDRARAHDGEHRLPEGRRLPLDHDAQPGVQPEQGDRRSSTTSRSTTVSGASTGCRWATRSARSTPSSSSAWIRRRATRSSRT